MTTVISTKPQQLKSDLKYFLKMITAPMYHRMPFLKETDLDSKEYERFLRVACHYFDVLSEREIEVISHRIGLCGVRLTLVEISQSMNISKEGVRQVESTSLKKMKKAITHDLNQQK